MSNREQAGPTAAEAGRCWAPGRRPWGRADAWALAAWTAAVAWLFWDAVSLRGALFYFDITEINFPYRDFFARELKAGRFSRWFPGLYCGLPLYSESQAGYLHPLKYALYPWLDTWKAFNLDTVLSVWLTGLGAYGWLRRHAGPSGALTGAAILGLSGFTWAHLVHTSMINALASVPLAFWALEVAWEGGRLRGVALGALALACQVFAGHLQDAILTGTALGVYGTYRAAVERGAGRRAFALGATVGMGLLAVLLSAVQWVPSKELIDRTPREKLTWGELTFGSWHPELLPTLVVREAYGTRARDTDWMDGFYPYHEMNAYLGVVGLALAVLGMAAYRDRWVGAWIVLGGLGLLLMLGRYTFLMDRFPDLPVIGRGRVPVRYHLWVVVATSALAAVGVDRLARPGVVRLRWSFGAIAAMALTSVPILVHAYTPAWTERSRWPLPSHAAHFRWLGQDLTWGIARTAALALAAWLVARAASREWSPARRARLAAALPLLALADLMAAHWHDSPTVDPSYWTQPPPSARWLKGRPDLIRVFGQPTLASGEPGHASRPVDFLAVRELLAWSLPPVWDLPSTGGETPILPTRRLKFTDSGSAAQLDVEGLSYIVTSQTARGRYGPATRVGGVYIHRNPGALPRVRLLGRPVYAGSEAAAGAALRSLGDAMRGRIVVEDPDRPLPADAEPNGSARIVAEVPERVEVEVVAESPAYLFLADSYDPGWTATLDGVPAPIRPAYVAFRAVFVPEGRHTVVFSYRPAGFAAGAAASGFGAALALVLLLGPFRLAPPGSGHGEPALPRGWPWWQVGLMAVILAGSTFRPGPDGGLVPQRRWERSVHRFTWGSGLEAMQPARPASE